MPVKVEMPTPDEMKNFFFEGMAGGYAAGEKAATDTPFTNWKTHDYHAKSKLWFLSDSWHAAPDSHMSNGYTTISVHAGGGWRTVWQMQYWGWYEEQAIPLLLEALHATYTKGIFLGGRGPAVLTQNGLQYRNETTAHNNQFIQFEGSEKIIRIGNEELLGTHSFRGGSLIHALTF